MLVSASLLGHKFGSIVDLAFFKKNNQPWFRGIFCYVSPESSDVLAYLEVYFTGDLQYMNWLADSNLAFSPTDIGVYNLKDSWMYGEISEGFRTITVQATNGVMPYELRRTGPIFWYEPATGDSGVSQLAHTYSLLFDRVLYEVFYSVELRRTVFYFANGPEEKLQELVMNITNPSSVQAVTVERTLKTSATFTQADVGVVRITFANQRIPLRVTRQWLVDVEINGWYEFKAKLRNQNELKPPIFVYGV